MKLIKRYPNLFLTLLLVCALLPPFTLKTFYKVEPYPAIILPSGAGKVDIKAKEISFELISLWSKDEKENIWGKIDIETFLKPIPIHYFRAIAKNSFGLTSVQEKNINQSKGFSVKQVAPNEIKTSKQWLRHKLLQSGFSSGELMITFERVKFDINNRKIITTTRNHEEVIRLD